MQKSYRAVLVLLVLLTGCAFDSVWYGSGDYVILDAPAVSELSVELGTPIHIHAHTNRIDEGLQMYVQVYGEVEAAAGLDITRQETNPPLTEGDGTWTPIDPMPPGDYRLLVRVMAERVNLTSRECLIHVYPPSTATSSQFSIQPSQTAAILPIPHSPSPSPTATSTSVPPIEIDFWADALTIHAGECSQLHWQVSHATWVKLNGSAVASFGEEKVCPNTTTSYTLQAGSPSEQLERTLVIQVLTPFTQTPDTAGPVIESIHASAQKVYWPPNCTPAEVTIQAVVQDASGVESVILYYRLVDGKRQGKWLQKELRLSAAQTYSTTLYYKDFMLTLNPPVESGSVATVQYYLVATDTQGNRTQSMPYADVLLFYCE